MTFYQRAFRYLRRQRTKSVILLACFISLSTVILCCSMILQAAQASNQSIREKTGTKIVLENYRGQNSIAPETVVELLELPHVTKIHAEASANPYPVGFTPITAKDSIDPLNLTVTIHASDDTRLNSLFAQEKYRLLEGTHITENQNGILVNGLLAETNGWNIGDNITLATEDGATIIGTIIGIFFSGAERKQAERTMAAYRIENQIYVDFSLFEDLYGSIGYSSVSLFTDAPDRLDALTAQAEQIVESDVNITSSDALYRQMAAPLKQVTSVTVLMLALTMTTSVIVISLLLCMWMRTRAKEMAVFLSLGLSKWSLILQTFTESMVLFSLSVLGAAFFCGLFGNTLMESLFSSGDFTSITDTHSHPISFLMLLALGSIVVLTAVGISTLPILRANPRDTLAKMEG